MWFSYGAGNQIFYGFLGVYDMGQWCELVMKQEFKPLLFFSGYLEFCHFQFMVPDFDHTFKDA